MLEDALPNNPHICAPALADLHEDAWRWARSLVADPAAADDILQQAYVMIITGSARYGARSTLKTWLFGVIRNIVRSQHRADQREGRLRAILTSEASLNEVPSTCAPVDEEPTARLARGLQQLPSRQREVLELTIYRDCTLEESATILGISIGSARTHYHRGKNKLRVLCGDISPA